MKPVLLVTCVVSGAALLGGEANAQPIYRCGNEYSRIPCAGGRTLDTGDTRSAAQRAEARQQIADQRRLANEMERDRLRREAAIKPAQAGSLSAPPPAASSPAAAKKGVAKKRRGKAQDPSDDFLAGVPAQKKR